MIENITINGVHMTVDEDLTKYVMKKIANLDKYMSKHVRESVHAEVWLKESKAKDKRKLTCEAKMTLPKDVLITSETTLNIYAAVDIVEAKLKNQILKYKDLHSPSKIRHSLNLLRKKRGAEI
ncbi:MAG: ribosome-associated translation inhibitor RaiA [Candidatus Saccharibacteria bacterium]|jgi:ribosomal subunit interface protein